MFAPVRDKALQVMDSITEASLDATGQAEQDLNNLTLQASWLYVGTYGELNEVGPGKMNDDESACKMTAAAIGLS